MKAAAGTLILSVLVLAGCRATQDVVETSYHVATAPVHLVHRAVSGHDEPPPPVAPDVTNPGRPVPAASATPSRQLASESRSSSRSNEPPKTRSSPPPAASNGAVQPQFPTANPVPGRPGLVYNPYNSNGGYIDVSGYAPGSKVKDPDSQKIFVVP
jgi:hypothetical protein